VHRALVALTVVITTTVAAVGTVTAAPAGQMGEVGQAGRTATAVVAVARSSSLAVGQAMRPGTIIASPNGFVMLRMQGDGNLVMGAGSHVLFDSGTRGAGNYAQVDALGDFVISNAAHQRIWATYTRGNTNVLRVGDDGNLVLAGRTGRVAWSSHTHAGELDQGGMLRPGQFLSGPRGGRLTQQGDGNLVLRRADGRIMWNAQTGRHPGAHTVLQSDGNLVTYSTSGRPLWYSGMAGPRASATLGADGVLSVRRANGGVAWSSAAPATIRPVNPAPVTAAGYASAILRMWGGKVTGLPGAYSDLLATSRGLTITNSDSCGQTVRVDIRIVAFLYDVTSKYRVKINNIITGHGCDSARHPRGMATDIGGAWNISTGAATSFGGYWGPNNTSMDAQFATYASSILPVGSGLGQRYCAGTSSANVRAGIAWFADNCNHQHVQV